jgi:hypothetical protein
MIGHHPKQNLWMVLSGKEHGLARSFYERFRLIGAVFGLYGEHGIVNRFG